MTLRARRRRRRAWKRARTGWCAFHTDAGSAWGLDVAADRVKVAPEHGAHRERVDEYHERDEDQQREGDAPACVAHGYRTDDHDGGGDHSPDERDWWLGSQAGARGGSRALR